MSVSKKHLQEMFRELSASDIKALKAALDGATNNPARSDAMDTADKLIGGYGVEAIRGESNSYQSYFGDIVALYVNTGDIYNATVVYDVAKRQFYATTMGDWVEWATSRRVDRVEVW